MADKVVVTPTVGRCLNDAVAYITNVLCAPQAATNLAEAFAGILDSLENNPTFYVRDFRASRLFRRTIYKRRAGNYRIYYFVADNSVVVFAFLHERQDEYPRLKTFYSQM